MPKIASYKSVLQQFKNWAKITKIKGKAEDYGLHSFHRGAVTNASNYGCPDHFVMKAMRVSSVKVVQTYASINEKSLAKASKSIFRKF